MSAANVHASFPQPRYKKVRYACTYLVLSANDHAKVVRELTQLVCETTSHVSEQDVDETTRRRNHSKPNWLIILDEKEIHLLLYASETFR